MHSAKRFVETALKLYAHERTFDLSFGGFDEMEPAAEEFERIGCFVTRDRGQMRLIVECQDEAPITA